MIKFSFKKLALDYIQSFLGFLILCCLSNLIFGVFIGIDTNFEQEIAIAGFEKLDTKISDIMNMLSTILNTLLVVFGMVILIIFFSVALSKKEELSLQDRKYIAVSIIIVTMGTLFFIIMLSDGINFNTAKFKDFISTGFEIIYKFCIFLFILLKTVLAYKFYKSKDIYYITSIYAKAFKDKNLKYFVAEDFIDPKDMGRNMANFLYNYKKDLKV